MITGLIFEASCNNKLWPMSPKSKRSQSRSNEKQSGPWQHPTAELVKRNQTSVSLQEAPTCGQLTSQDSEVHMTV